MKIIYMHQYFNTPEMSGGTRSYEMARRMVAAGHEVHMITSWQSETKYSDWFESYVEGIHVHWLPVLYSNYMSFNQRVWAFLKFALKASIRAKKVGGDVVFATSTPLTIAIPGVRIARTLKVPLVFEVRDLWPELPIAVGALKNPILKKLAYWLERWAYRNSDHIVALSDGMKDGVLRSGCSDRPITVVPNSADLDLFSNRQRSSNYLQTLIPDIGEKRAVVYAGTLGAINGVSYMVSMAEQSLSLGHRHVYIVIGDGAEKSEVIRAAEDGGVLNRNFYIFPPVTKCEIPNVLGGADVALSLFVNLKSMWQNSANKFFDALASGTPVAINYGGWQADLIERNGCGLLLPIDNPRGGAIALSEFLDDESKRVAAGVSARRLAESSFSRDKLARDLINVIESVVGS